MELTEATNQDTQKSIQELQTCWLALKRRWLPATAVFGSIVGLSILGVIIQKPSYEAKGKLLFQTDLVPSLTGVAKELSGADSLAPQSNPTQTKMEVIQAVPLIQKTIDTLRLQDDDGTPLRADEVVTKRLKLKVIKSTDVVSVAYKSADPQKAAAFVNTLMGYYIESSILESRKKTAAAIDFISTQLPKAQAAVRLAGADLRRFKEKNKVVSLNTEATQTVNSLATLNDQIIDVKRNLAATENGRMTLQRQIGLDSQSASVLASLSQTEGVQKALTELQEIEAKLAVQRTRFTSTAPVIVNLVEQQTALNSLLQQRVNTTLSSRQFSAQRNLQLGSLKQEQIRQLLDTEVKFRMLTSQLTTLSEALKDYQQRAQAIPRLEQEERELQRQLDVSQAIYQGLLQKLQEAKLAERQTNGNAQIIEPAQVPEKASIMRPLLTLSVGMVIAILGAVITVLRLELQDSSLKTLRELRDLLDFPLLGLIPSYHKKSKGQKIESEVPQLPVHQEPQSLISEAYRMLQANLKFASSLQSKVVTVTSAVPKEGKSTTAANLASAVSQLGQRVLLIDADLRHPVQHLIWDLNGPVGLSHVLTGQAELGDSVQSPLENLDVLTVGVVPPNPMALLSSQRFTDLMRACVEMYDLVIIDSPPLIAAADALTLAKQTDGVLFVTRPGVVNAAAIRAAKESLERADQKVLGLVVNGVIPENEPDSYFHFADKYYSEPSSRKVLAAASRS